MAIEILIPGRPAQVLEHVVVDVNGTLTDRGELLDGVAAPVERLRRDLELVLVSADTFGAVAETARRLGVEARIVRDGEDKRQLVDELGAERTVVIGNGTNDAPALAAAALGIVVLGPEGTSGDALRAADVLCRSAVEALELLLDPQALVATLRR